MILSFFLWSCETQLWPWRMERELRIGVSKPRSRPLGQANRCWWLSLPNRHHEFFVGLRTRPNQAGHWMSKSAFVRSFFCFGFRQCASYRQRATVIIELGGTVVRCTQIPRMKMKVSEAKRGKSRTTSIVPRRAEFRSTLAEFVHSHFILLNLWDTPHDLGRFLDELNLRTHLGLKQGVLNENY